MPKLLSNIREKLGSYLAEVNHRRRTCLSIVFVLLCFTNIYGAVLNQLRGASELAITFYCLGGVSFLMLWLVFLLGGKLHLFGLRLYFWIAVAALTIASAAGLLASSQFALHSLYWVPLGCLVVILFTDFIPGVLTGLAVLIESIIYFYTPAFGGSNPLIDQPTRFNFLAVFVVAIVIGAMSSIASADISEIQGNSAKRFEELATRDSLTGIHNRMYMVQWVKSLHFEEGNKEIDLGVLFVDLDFLKKINDQMGHASGNIAIKTVATVLSNQNPEVLLRYGGDEFVILQTGATNESLKAMGENILKEIHELYVEGVPDNHVSVSLGGYVGKASSTEDVFQCIEHADAKLYESKRNGKNRLSI